MTGNVSLSGEGISLVPGNGGGGGSTTIVAGANLTGGTITTSGTIGLETIAADSLFGNFGTVAGTLEAIAIGTNLTLTSSGTLNASGASGTTTTIVAGNNLTGGTISTAGTIGLETLAATSLFGNAATVAGTMAAVAIGTGLSLTSGGTLNAIGTGSVTSVVAQGGPFLANGTITSSGTISNSASSLTAHGVLIGEGASAVVAAAAMTNGQLLIGATSADPAPQTMSGDATINAGGTLALGSIVASGTVGSVSQIPIITFDTKGRITNATTAAVPVTAANLGAVLNSGTVQVNNNVTLAGTAAGTLSINPSSGTSDVIVNMPSAGGTVTLSYSGAFAYQPFRLHIKQGATAGVIVLNTGTVNGFVFGAVGGPTSFTLTASAGVTDDLACLGITTAYARIEAINQGFTA